MLTEQPRMWGIDLVALYLAASTVFHTVSGAANLNSFFLLETIVIAFCAVGVFHRVTWLRNFTMAIVAVMGTMATLGLLLQLPQLQPIDALRWSLAPALWWSIFLYLRRPAVREAFERTEGRFLRTWR